MKNEIKGYQKVGIIIFFVILLGLSIVLFVDQVFNGVLKEWIYNLFVIEPDYPGQGKIGVLFKSWNDIKQFIRITFFVMFIVFVTCVSILVYFITRYRSNKDISLISNKVNSFMSDSDELILPKKYSEIETQLLRIKTLTQNQQQLMQMEMQRKSDLITYLAHDLKTPLASVIGYLSLLDEVVDMPAEQKIKYTGIALEKAFRLEDLINEFFDITRFNLQSVILNKGRIKLAFMLYQLVDEFYPMLTPQGKQVAIHASDDLILEGDADKLARVFNNILKNAIAYSYENTIIEITADLQDEDVVITFTNYGDPIPSHKLQTIFEKFYRLDSARSTNTGGAGLGLAIAQEIITAHGGVISVESNSATTKFTVKLPS